MGVDTGSLAVEHAAGKKVCLWFVKFPYSSYAALHHTAAAVYFAHHGRHAVEACGVLSRHAAPSYTLVASIHLF